MRKRIVLITLLAMVLTAGTSPAWAKTKSSKTKTKTSHTQVAESTSETSNSLEGTGSSINQDITLEPLGFIFGAGTLAYEHLINRNSSWVAGVKFGGLTLGDWQYGAFGVEGAYRFFPLKKFRAPRGLWFGPAVEIMNYSWSYHNPYDNYTASISTTYVNLLAEAGWQFIFGSESAGFVLSPYLGMGYSLGMGTTTLDYYGTTETIPNGGGFTAFIGCSLGFGF
jgi:hypothetical protein